MAKSKWKVGARYRISHAQGMWSGVVKLLDLDQFERGLIKIVHLTKTNDMVSQYWESRGNEGWLGNSFSDWNPKLINPDLENK